MVSVCFVLLLLLTRKRLKLGAFFGFFLCRGFVAFDFLKFFRLGIFNRKS
jgi:hypothetical protein